jgi:hypothetical protein
LVRIDLIPKRWTSILSVKDQSLDLAGLVLMISIGKPSATKCGPIVCSASSLVRPLVSAVVQIVAPPLPAGPDSEPPGFSLSTHDRQE